MKLLEIDGAHGEGGGQLARLAVALAAITGRSLRLYNIRAGRARPGLGAQHLTALRAVAELCQGRLEGAALGAGEVILRPGGLQGGGYRFEVGTAGSVALVLQAVLPVALHADGPCRLRIRGGTDVKLAPTLDYLRLVFLPWLAHMGAQVRLLGWHRGYYPRGGGEIELEVSPGRNLRPLVAEERGAIETIVIHAHVAHLPMYIAERMARAAQERLGGTTPLQVTAQVLGDAEATGMGGALTLVARTEHGRLGVSMVAERGVSAERLGEEAGQALRLDLDSGAALDVHAGDQLLVYAALAAGESRFTVRRLSLHARTAMWLIERFLPVRFLVTEESGRTLIRLVRT